MGIKNVFKWRVTTNKYLYLTDEENQAPFILDKRTGDRTYPQPISGSTVTGTTVITGMTLDEGLISQTVSNIKSADSYSEKYDKMVALAPFDNDTSKLTFLEYDKYFNLDGAECVEEAVTPKCEGYEPVFNVSAYTLQNSGETEVEYTFYAERNEADKTLRYNLELGIPRGEKGEKGDDGIGCKGDKGDDGLPAIIENVEADITAIDPDEEASVDVITRVVGDNEYELDFDFRIPRGEQGEEGPSGDEGPAGWDAVVNNVTATATALTPGSTPYAIIPTSSITINENAQDKVNETSFRIDFGLPTGLQGVQGNDGRNAEIREVTASVETLEPGYWYPSEDDPNRSWIRNDAEVGVDVTPGGGGNVIDLHFWFKIPRGDKGDKGDMGGGGGGGSSRIFYDFDNVVVHTTTEAVPYFTLHEEPTEIAGITFIRVWLEFFYPEDWGGGGGAACDDDCRKHRYDHYQNNSDSLSEGMVQVINGVVYPLATAQGVRSHAEGIGMYAGTEMFPAEIKDYDSSDKDGFYITTNNGHYTPSYITPQMFDGATVVIDGTNYILHVGDRSPGDDENAHFTYDTFTITDNRGNIVFEMENAEIITDDLSTHNNFTVVINNAQPNAIGIATHTEGRECQAFGDYSHAEGWSTITNNSYSHAEGLGTYTTNLSEHAEGQYNVSHSEDRTEFSDSNGCSTVLSIGIGDSDSSRKNAVEVMQNGDVYIYGVGGYDGTEVKCQDLNIQTLQDVLSDSSHGTVTNIATGTGLTGGPITSSGTISHADTSSQESINNSGTRKYIQNVGLDGMGHVTSLTTAEETVVNTDTKVTSAANHYGYTSGSGKASGLYKVAIDDAGHVTSATAVVKDDITALGIPGSDTDTTYKLTLNGTQKGSGTTDLGTFYAPTGGGTSGQYLKSNGNGAPTWATFPTIPSAPGTLNTTATTSQTTATGESLSGTINLHKISKTGSYDDLLNKPTIPVNTDYQVQQSSITTNAGFCLLAKSISGTGNTTVTSTTIFTTGITINPAENSIYCTGAYYASSDARKKDIVKKISLDKAYELVEKCQTIFYTWKDDEEKQLQIGLLAQEVQEYFPELVSEGSDDYLTLDYSKLTVILLAVIRDLTARVKHLETLEERIKSLEEKLK